MEQYVSIGSVMKNPGEEKLHPVFSKEGIRRSKATVVNICPWDQFEMVGHRKEKEQYASIDGLNDKRIQNRWGNCSIMSLTPRAVLHPRAFNFELEQHIPSSTREKIHSRSM